MSQIASVFKPDYKALIAYLTVGYPDLETTRKAAIALAGSGVDIIELGIPFSDPLADGTTIQRASHRALQNWNHAAAMLSDSRTNTPGNQHAIDFYDLLQPGLSFRA